MWGEVVGYLSVRECCNRRTKNNLQLHRLFECAHCNCVFRSPFVLVIKRCKEFLSNHPCLKEVALSNHPFLKEATLIHLHHHFLELVLKNAMLELCVSYDDGDLLYQKSESLLLFRLRRAFLYQNRDALD